MNGALQVASGSQYPGCTNTEVSQNSNIDAMFAGILEMLNKEILNKEILNKEILIADPLINTNSIFRGKQKYEPCAEYTGIQSIFVSKRMQLSGQELSAFPTDLTDEIADQEKIKESSSECTDCINFLDWTAGLPSAASINATTTITGQIEQAKSPPENIQFEPAQTPEMIALESEKHKADTGGNNKNAGLEQSNIIKSATLELPETVIQTKNNVTKEINLANEGNASDKDEAVKPDKSLYKNEHNPQIYPGKPEISQENFKEIKKHTFAAEQRIVIEPIINLPEGKQSDISQKSIELPIHRVSDELPEIIKHEYQNINGRESSRGLIVQLEPKELGKILVKLIKHDGIVSVKILVEQQESKALLDNSLSNLKQGLSEQGVKYGRIDVEVGSQFMGQNNRQSPNWFKEQRTQRGYNLNETHYYDDDYEKIRAVGRAGTNNGVDYLA